MRIGFDAKRLYNNFTGLGNHSRTTIDILTEYFPGNEYLLFTPKIKQDPVVEKYLHKDHCQTLLPGGMMKGSLWRTFCLGREAGNHRADIFHGLSNELPIGLNIPSIVTIHDVAFHTFKDMYHWHDRQIYDMKWRFACRHADRIIAISECTKRDIIKFYDVDEAKIDVVYQPVNPIYYRLTPDRIPSQSSPTRSLSPTRRGEFMLYVGGPSPASPKRRSPYILYVGSINSRKNLLGIVKAMKLLPKDLLLPLVIVGNGREYKREVLRYISENGLQELVKFHDSVNDPHDLHDLYRNATLFVYPSFYEGFGLPVVEAMLSRCPVVTSNVSSLPEAGGPFSLKADPASAEDIALQMQKLLESESLRQEISKKSYDYAMQTFHPEVLSKQLMNVYEKIRK